MKFNKVYYTDEDLLKTTLELLLECIDRINSAIKYCEESSKTIKSEYFSDVLKILKGE